MHERCIGQHKCANKHVIEGGVGWVSKMCVTTKIDQCRQVISELVASN